MKIRAISKAVILALAGGTKVEALGLANPVANVEGVAPEAEDVVALTAEATEIQAVIDKRVADASAAAVAAATTPLAAQVASLGSKVTLLEAGAADLTGKVTASNELAASFTGVVRASIATMCVTLGATDNTLALQGKALLDEHDKLAEQFKKKFPAGGVAAVQPVTQPDAKKSVADDIEFLAFAGTR